ncbi:MAG: AbrB/MazE/SpoVT family DNA-binding domain-containing protein [bacterium]
MQTVKISPKGQITIPKSARDAIKGDMLSFEIRERVITLRPVKVVVDDNELKNFASASEKSFEFWDNEEDDVYQEFYEQN